MCEFNRPYPMRPGTHPDDRCPRLAGIPSGPWPPQGADPALVEIVAELEQQAAALHGDIHLYRRRGSLYVGVAIMPGAGPAVRIWEHAA